MSVYHVFAVLLAVAVVTKALTEVELDEVRNNGDCYDEAADVVHRNRTSFQEDCNRCFCSDGLIGCTQVLCNTDCYYKGTFYEKGDSFTDKCNWCMCLRNGEVSCTKRGCYGGCYNIGQLVEEGTTFMDKCNRCMCRNNRVACTRKVCPPGCYGGGLENRWYYRTGESYMKDCSTCTCDRRGRVACTIGGPC